MRLCLQTVPLLAFLAAAQIPGVSPARVALPSLPAENGGAPLYLAGRVAFSDGLPFAESVPIDLVCGGQTYREEFTDFKGYFNVELGGATAGTVPGEARGDRHPGSWAGCELVASLAGFRSESVPLTGRSWGDSPNLGTITLHRMAHVEGFTVSATSSLAPKDARKAYEKGLKQVARKKPNEAIQEFQKAVGIYPKFAAAWYGLGSAYEQRGQTSDARSAYLQAIAADADYISPYERLYMLAVREQEWQEAAEISERVTRLNPFDFPAAYYFNAVSNLELNRLDAAEKSAREALKLDKARRNPKTNYILGLILGRKRRFPEAASFLRAYLDAAPNAPDAEAVGKQLAETERMAGQQ